MSTATTARPAYAVTRPADDTTATVGDAISVPYRVVGSSGVTGADVARPLLELVDDHPATCRCSFGPDAVQRGYPHHLIPAAEPWGRRRPPTEPGVAQSTATGPQIASTAAGTRHRKECA